jgi:hypothetical protein
MDWGFDWLFNFINGFWATIDNFMIWTMDGVLYICQEAIYLQL